MVLFELVEKDLSVTTNDHIYFITSVGELERNKYKVFCVILVVLKIFILRSYKLPTPPSPATISSYMITTVIVVHYETIA